MDHPRLGTDDLLGGSAHQVQQEKMPAVDISAEFVIGGVALLASLVTLFIARRVQMRRRPSGGTEMPRGVVISEEVQGITVIGDSSSRLRHYYEPDDYDPQADLEQASASAIAIAVPGAGPVSVPQGRSKQSLAFDRLFETTAEAERRRAAEHSELLGRFSELQAAFAQQQRAANRSALLYFLAGLLFSIPIGMMVNHWL